MHQPCRTSLSLFGAMLLIAAPPLFGEIDWKKAGAETFEHFTRLVRIDTSNPPGNETALVKYLQGVLEKEGVSCKLVGADSNRLSLIARLKGSGAKKPLLMLGHTDVVGVQRERWSQDPFGAKLIDGYIWGRGTLDDKPLVAGGLMTMLLLKRSGAALDRDVIFVAEAGEEGGGGRASGATHGIAYIIEHNWPDIDAEYALTEGGGFDSEGGRILYQKVQLAEKVRKGMLLVSHGTAGHGSMPREDNAIVHLSMAVAKVAEWQPPMRLNDVTRTYFERLSLVSPPADAARYKALFDASQTAAIQSYFRKNDIESNSELRTTISPSIIQGGFRSNVIPSEATATLDIRAVPGEDMEKFKAEMIRIINDPDVKVEPGVQEPSSPASHMNTEMFRALESAAKQIYPGAVTLPWMSTGGSDMLNLRIKGIESYGIGAEVPKEDVVTHAIHSDNERIKEDALYKFIRYEFEVVAAMATKPSR
jgi:acetylornithine deacetylase/succinyl-diaminopimelate desuccinylase-like protein